MPPPSLKAANGSAATIGLLNMSDENSELDYLDDNNSFNVELESFEALSTVSSAPSQILELGRDGEEGSKPFHLVHQIYGREVSLFFMI